MKEIILYEDDESKETASIGEDAVLITWYDRGDNGNLFIIDSHTISKEDIKKIYQVIEEE